MWGESVEPDKSETQILDLLGDRDRFSLVVDRGKSFSLLQGVK
jgi:hypothetical protein